jgi:acetolactate synthase-1/2/3 large subunit
VHVHADAEELGRVYHPHLGIHATPAAFCAALAELRPPKQIPWADATRQSRADYIAWTEKPSPSPGSVHIGEVAIYVRDHIPADAIITNGAGNFAGWVQRYMRYRAFGTQLAPASGSMGYGVPAAVGAKRVQPNRTVICFAGDGDFLMNGQEFATAVQYDLPIVVILLDNGMYGTIRMHQERDYPGRISATVLKNPDFAAYARAFGGHGETVERTADFGPAFERAVKSGKPAIIHVKVDPEAITPTTTLSQIREKALAATK